MARRITRKIRVMDLMNCLDRIFNHYSENMPPDPFDDPLPVRKNARKINTALAKAEYLEDIEYVSAKMNLCEEEIVLLSCVLGNMNCEEKELAKYLNCTNIEFMRYKKHLISLCRKRVFYRMKYFHRGNQSAYRVSENAYDAILDNTEFNPVKYDGISTEDMFTEFRKVFKCLKDEAIDFDAAYADLNMFIDNNGQNKFVQCFMRSRIRDCSESEQILFLFLCHRFVSWDSRQVEKDETNWLLSPKEDESRFYRYFTNGKLKCQEYGLVTFGGEGEFEDKDSMALTDKVTKEFFSEVVLVGDNNSGMQHKDLHSPEKIKEKVMYYNPKEEEQVARLSELLSAENFTRVQSRLEEKGMRTGFNVIFYGGPGTGKTETIMQIAKKTGREVFIIDVSKIKNKYVGESEKSIKGVFQLYRRFCEGKKVQPILLFNEADAIFGKRLESVNSSADQMQNSMQNIILQEMENLEGILVATTNLHVNLDPAFERRFLYKIEFSTPESEVREKLWKSMLPGLNDEDYAELGKKYNFSGGQIENISRKSTVDYVLSGAEVCVDKIEKYCEEEIFVSKRKKVGYF